MIDSIWKLNINHPEYRFSRELSKRLSLNNLLTRLLVNRGFDDINKIQEALTLEGNEHDPKNLSDIQKAKDRIQNAIDNDEQIVIYGDYDVDGVTSTAILYSLLKKYSNNIEVYIPNRFKDGYGPNLERYKELFDNDQKQLLIAVDNGITGIKEIKYLNSIGVDSIIFDHHKLGDEIPESLAVVHPLTSPQYPFKDLSAAGVAYKFAKYFDGSDFSQLAALGEIADVMPVIDENKVIIKHGLDQINSQPILGIKRLLQVASNSDAQVDAQTVGFQIAPRINSFGRMEDANEAFQLLISESDFEASALAQKAQALNNSRRAIVEDLMIQAEKQITAQQDQEVLIVYGEDWNEGLIGLVAGKLTQKYQRPTIAFSKKGNILKGSARSILEIDIHTLLMGKKEIFTSLGGHSQAAGMSLDFEDLDQLRELVSQVPKTDHKQVIEIDEEITLKDITSDNIDSLKTLQPFGNGNPEPVFLLANVQVAQMKRLGANKKTAKFNFNGSNATAIMFNFEDDDILPGTQISMIGRLSKDKYNNPQLMIFDYKVVSGVPTKDEMSTRYVQIKSATEKLSEAGIADEIFNEIKFVNIEGGFVELNENAAPMSLLNSPTYQKKVIK